MPKITMPAGDWHLVVTVLAMAAEIGLVAYVDNIINEIDSQLARQEHGSQQYKCPECGGLLIDSLLTRQEH